jgi:predicted component of type VI protein secretion system
MQAVLVMFRSDGERRSFSVTRDVTVIGRREDCDLRIPVHDVSRKHARLIREGDQLRIEDLGSSNGTHLNGQRIERDAIVQAGDSIQVGPVVFVVQFDGYPADEELHPITAESAASAEMFAPDGGAAVPTMGAASAGEEGELEPLEELDDLEPLPAGHGAVGGDGAIDLADPLEELPAEDLHAPLPLADDEPLELHDEPIALADDHALDGGIELADEQHPPAAAPAAHHDPLDDLLIDIEPEPPGKHR